MRVSDAIRVDKDFRYWQKAKTLLQTIDYRMQWYMRAMPERVTPLHISRALEISMHMDRELQATKPLCEINRYLSRRPILTLPVDEILAWTFSGLPPPKKADLSVMDEAIASLLKRQYWAAQKQMHYFGLMCEIAYRHHHGWFIILNTLTVREGEYVQVFQSGSKAFLHYIRKIDRYFAQHLYGSIRNARGQLFHQYFACTEAGSEKSRLHIHCVHLVKHLPSEITDPNYGRTQPTEWVITRLRRFWRHGRSDPRTCRSSPNDAYGKLGWRWPLDSKTHEPYRLRSPLAIATYISKYIQKGYESCLRKNRMWRVKKSHNLGRALIDEITARLSTSTLLILSSTETIRAKLNGCLIPSTSLRLSCLRSLKNRNFQDTPILSGFDNLAQLAKRTNTRLSPLLSSRASIQTILENNQQSMQYLSIFGINNEASFEAAANDLRDSVWQSQQTYFPAGIKSYGAGSSRDDILIRTQPAKNTTDSRQPRNPGTKQNTRQRPSGRKTENPGTRL